jgi:hypothetical protein
MQRLFAALILAPLFLTLAPDARAQWQDGNLAVRTNGSVFQPGDRLKVELLALDRVGEFFYTQVGYRYSELETVEEKDADGNVSTKQVRRERVRVRQPGPALESIEAHRAITLDDTFTFSEDSPAGEYTVEVAVFRAYTRERVATIRAHVFFQEAGAPGEGGRMFLRGFKQAFAGNYVAFDGEFPADGRYSVVLLGSAGVVKHLKAGGYASGRREFHVASEHLSELAGRTVDVLVHDHLSNTSSTLARVTLPSGR